jgi:multidrug efflux pump
MSRFFIDRPIFAWVLSIVITLAGLVCVFGLPIAQYPPIVPPTISVSASFPGASADTCAATVAQPIEEQVNGVEGMIYMSSTCTNNGMYNLTVSFNVGMDTHTALMLVQTRVQLAMPQLPPSVQKQGVNVQEKSPNILLAVNLIDRSDRPESEKPLFLSNYAQINIFDELSRSPGVGLVSFLGQRQYSMRAWVDPQKLAALDITVSDVMNAIREQNVEVAAGNIGQQPVPKGQQYQLVLNALGRLTTSEQFGQIIVKVGQDGRYVRLKDISRLDLGAQNSDLDCVLTLSRFLDAGGKEIKDAAKIKSGDIVDANGKKVEGATEKLTRYPSVALAVFQLPSANALDTAKGIYQRMEELKKKFPKGVDYVIAYDTTPFIKHSVEDVFVTIFIAVVLVIIVVMVFIQDWRAMLLPMIDIVVSLIGTFVVMKILGFSLNNLSLFGLVLAVGIVVDDSIVVVENIERWMGMGLPAREATIKAMEEITGPVVGITLVLASVFIPTAFMPGLTGQFFRQFALTIAVSTMISATNALTMAPARAVVWIKPHQAGHDSVREALPRIAYPFLIALLAYYLLGMFLPYLGDLNARLQGELVALWTVRGVALVLGAVAGWIAGPAINAALGRFFGLFNRVFDRLTRGYTHAVGLLMRLAVIVLVIYVGLLGLTGVSFVTSPTGFIPEQDQGYLLVNVMLPDSASVQRTDAVIRELESLALAQPGVKQTMAVGGYSAFFACDASNWGTIFVILEDFDKRKTPETQGAYLARELNKIFATKEWNDKGGAGPAVTCVAPAFGAPPVPGLGQGGGFQLQLEDRTGVMSLTALQQVTETIVQKANQQPGLANVFTTFKANTPQLFLNIDRDKVKQMGVTLQDVFDTLNANMGSVYINQFNRFNRIWQVNIQAEGQFRQSIRDLEYLYVRNRQGQTVPLLSLLTVSDNSGPVFVMRYNNNNSTAINGMSRPGFSSGQAISVMQDLCNQNMPDGMMYEWTNISYQEVNAGSQGIFLFAGAIVLVFLVLSALYESWGQPFAVILVVPMCMLFAVAGLVWISHHPIDIFSQIGLVVLVALAAKNAILIVEYARDKHKGGMSQREATLEACRLRLRPILMTSLAFIFGVYPLVIATGAGWEMRRSLGIAVLSGMIGVTLFGIFLTPVFYYSITWLSGEKKQPQPPATAPGLPDGEHKVTTVQETAIQTQPSGAGS